ncbi:hypothetical protein [Streptomyces sp. NPDC088350]|uniref:hypothetical protein n=1 Tax=Streptomyces sp. NPDC088350 TaxID=3365854 RepID=UPI0037F33E6B
MVLIRTAQTEADARTLALAAHIPPWTMDSPGPGPDPSVASECFLRVLELAEHYRDDPDTVLRVGTAFANGQLGIYDYLFSSARTSGSSPAPGDTYRCPAPSRTCASVSS